MIVLLQEGVPVEADHLICDTSRAEEVSDSFRDQKNDLAAASGRWSETDY